MLPERVFAKMGELNSKQLNKLLERTVEALGCECWGLNIDRYGRRSKLSVFIDSPHGVTVKDCEVASTHISASLEESELLPGSYLLEVSSPGVERRLFKLSQFRLYLGQTVNIKCWAKVDGKKNFRGVIQSVEKETFTLKVEEENMTFSMDQVSHASLYTRGFKEALASPNQAIKEQP